MREFDRELNRLLVDNYHLTLQVEETQKKNTRSKLSFRDRNALEFIEAAEGGCRISDIAEFLRISKPSTTSLIKKLEGLGFVEKVSDKADERTTYARITKRGKLMCAYQRQYRNNMTEYVTKDMTEQEQQVLCEGIRKLNEFFEESIELTERIAESKK